MPAILSLLFSYNGVIGRTKYFLLALIAAGCALGAFFFLAKASDPKGSDSGLLVFPFLVAFIWIFSAAVVRRLRDAGWSGGQRWGFALVPVLWIAATVVFNDLMMVLIPLGGAAIVVTPGLAGLRSNAAAES